MCLCELSGRPAGPFCVCLIPTPLRTASRSRPAAQNPRLGDPAACWLFNASPRSRLCSADLQKPSKTPATRTGKRHRAPPHQGLARSRGTAWEAEAWPRALPLAGSGAVENGSLCPEPQLLTYVTKGADLPPRTRKDQARKCGERQVLAFPRRFSHSRGEPRFSASSSRRFPSPRTVHTELSAESTCSRCWHRGEPCRDKQVCIAQKGSPSDPRDRCRCRCYRCGREG